MYILKKKLSTWYFPSDSCGAMYLRYIYLFFRRVIFVSPAMFAALRHTHTYVYLEGEKITVILSSRLLRRDTSILYRHVTSVSRNDCICCLKRRYTHTKVYVLKIFFFKWYSPPTNSSAICISHIGAYFYEPRDVCCLKRTVESCSRYFRARMHVMHTFGCV